jgi:DNA-binding FadR family transcriptional regulator
MRANGSATLQPLDYQGRHAVIQERLKSFIIENQLQAGDHLPTEDVLAAQLGVSRNAVREALRGLEALGMVAPQQGVGRVVQPFSFQPILNNLSYGFTFQNVSILQLLEVRKALDAHFSVQAMHCLTEDDLAELAALVGRMKARAAAGQDMNEEDHTFHELLYRRCGNPLALELFEIAWQARLAALDRTSVVETPPGTAGEHEALLEALRRRDEAKTRSLVTGHHWNAEERFRRQLERGCNAPGAPKLDEGGET